MKYTFMRAGLLCSLALGMSLPLALHAQNKQTYSSLEEALQSAGALYGSQGPQSVNWTDGGNKYSYTSNDEIRSMDPATLKDELVFNAKGLKFPEGGKDFNYESFQWSHD